MANLSLQSFLFLIPLGISLYLYTRTMNPDMAAGDWGELVTNAYLLSPSHPPGYPLFILMYHVWIHYICAAIIPDTSVAYRSNLLNTIVSAAAVAILQKAIVSFMRSYNDDRLNLSHYLSSILGSLLFGLGPTVWHYAGHAEVFALNNFFLALILWLLCECLHHRKMSYIYSGALVSGLALANQQTSVIYLAVFIPWILYSVRGTLNLKRLIYLGLFFIAGLSPYATLAFMDSNPLSWGDLTSIRGFWRHITREEYGSLQLYSTHNSGPKTSPLYTAKIAFYLKSQFGSLLYIFVPIGAIIWILSIRGKKKIVSLPLLGALTLYLTAFFHLCNLPFHEDVLFEGIFSRFFMQPNTVFIVFFSAFAADQMIRVSSAIPQRVSRVLLFLFFSLVVLYAVKSQYSSVDQSSNAFVRAYGTALLDDLPQNAVVSISGDMELYSMAYLNLVERHRPDVTVLSTGFLSSVWIHKKFKTSLSNIEWPGEKWSGAEGGFTIGALLQANLLQRPIAFIPGFPEEDPSWKHPMFNVIRRGLAQIATPRQESTPSNSLVDQWKLSAWPKSLDKLPAFDVALPYGPDSWETRTFELVCFYRFKIVLNWAGILSGSVDEFSAPKAAKPRLSELLSAINQTLLDVKRMKSWVPREKLDSTYTPSLHKALGFAWFAITKHMESNRILQWGPQKISLQAASDRAMEAMQQHCKLNPHEASCKKNM